MVDLWFCYLLFFSDRYYLGLHSFCFGCLLYQLGFLFWRVFAHVLFHLWNLGFWDIFLHLGLWSLLGFLQGLFRLEFWSWDHFIHYFIINRRWLFLRNRLWRWNFCLWNCLFLFCIILFYLLFNLLFLRVLYSIVWIFQWINLLICYLICIYYLFFLYIRIIY